MVSFTILRRDGGGGGGRKYHVLRQVITHGPKCDRACARRKPVQKHVVFQYIYQGFCYLTLRQLNITNYNGLVNIENPFISHGCIRETQMSIYENRKHPNSVFKQLKRLSNSTSCERG